MNKKELRAEMKEKRKRLSAESAKEMSRRICENFWESDFYKNANSIALYMAIGNEVDLSELIKRAFKDKKRVFVPVTDKENKDIDLFEISEDTVWVKGDFGILEPEKRIPCNGVDVMLVPGIAFSFHGARVGWGGGFYDRLIPKMNAVTVGICYDFQITGTIETEPHDLFMNYILTESELVICD